MSSIIERLETLRKWQEEQQKMLLEKQIAQRQLLQKEQTQMYKILGINSSIEIESNENVNEYFIHSDSSEDSCNNEEQPNPKRDQEVAQTLREKLRLDKSTKDGQQQVAPSMQKRTYLKRGEGLTNRFRVHPNVFRLENLPHYKYANLHKKRELKQQKQSKNCNQLVLKKQSKTISEEVLCSQIDSHNSQQKCSTKVHVKSIETETDTKNYLNWAAMLNNSSITGSETSQTKWNDASQSGERQRQKEIEDLNLFEILEENAEYSVKEHSLIEESSVDSDNESDRLRNTRHVHFSDNIEINELSIEDTNSEEAKSCIEQSEKVPELCGFQYLESQTPDIVQKPIHSQDFTDLSSIEILPTNSQSVQADKHRDVTEKTELLKRRLAQLEKEIDNFRQQNLLLVKMKQEHELQRVQLERDRTEFEDKLEQKRNEMESYFNDERQKINQDKIRYKKLLHQAKTPTRTEREELAKMKEKLSKMETELKEKENRHAAAQSRYRSQSRISEKESKDQLDEITTLKKENHRLLTEVASLRRQTHNKMLQEINKNIAKLTPIQINETHSNENSSKLIGMSRKSRSHLNTSVKRHSVATATVTKHTNKFGSQTGLIQARSKSVPNLKTYNENHHHIHSFSSSEENSSESESIIEQLQTPDQCVLINKKSPPKIDKENTSTLVLKKTAGKILPSSQTSINLKNQITNADGSLEVHYPNGNVKKVSPDGMIIRMIFFNKDIKTTDINEGTVKYFYAETNIWHTSYLDGREKLEYSNGHIEHRFKDGVVEEHFTNGTIRITNPNDPAIFEEMRYPDGTKVFEKRNGDKIVSFSNGQREIHTKAFKRRDYPDGTVKMLYPDGSQETRYANGRVRLKNKEGKLIMDSETLLQ